MLLITSDSLRRAVRNSVVLVIAVILTVPATMTAAARDNYFDTLQQMLIKDGFDKTNIKTLYQDPRVSFDIAGISSFFAHREARLNYNQFITSKAIKKARKYMRAFRSDLEQAEKLEQLRFLQHGLKIKVHETDQEVVGIDTPQDLAKAEEFAKLS